jgi:hypothetical protein
MQLPTQDCASVFATAVNVGKQLEELDKRARNIIDAIRERHRRRAPGEVLPPPPPELLELQKKKEETIEWTFQAITRSLSPAGVQALQSFATNGSKSVTAGQNAGGGAQ